MAEENVSTYLDPAEESMEMAVAYLEDALTHIRAGKANPRLLDAIRVNYYGSQAPISNVANIAVPDARTITITPWEKSMFKEIEKAIINSALGITPENNGEVIRLTIPPLTEERRKQLVKQSKSEAENAKVSVRNARREAIEGLKKAIKKGMPEDVEKDAEAKAQKLHDKYLKKIDELFALKEKEILTV
ncbi:MAG: ribosome recycling factor [Bacteroidales bacterium]|nr:ribosome recycling factor [Bacteroidales bacterium]